MKKVIGTGVMGCAAIADRSFIPAIKAMPEHFRLVAVASRDPRKAGDFAERHGCEGHAGYEKLLARDDIDALYIPLPTGLHKEWVIRALEAGKHVYAEKAFAINHRDASMMVDVATRKGLALMEGYMFQYHAQQGFVKQLLADGAIGELRHFEAAFGFPLLPPGNFRYDMEIGGGVLTDAAGYPVRAAFFWLGDNLQLSGASLFRDQSSGTEMFGSAYLSGPGGVGASIAFGFGSFYQCRVTFWGSSGKLSMMRAFTPRPDDQPLLILETPAGTTSLNAPADNHFVGALKAFHDAISGTGRERLYTDILQQSKTIEMIRKISG
ncbi:MAG TPA: Gfo/Idh/MocA family oxidoreductase [Bacteroidales bacterium]|nr:Gfo/Idh/MocA family oxidoreductase [Bacteroidales bacterium]